jgi:hypothetical protein
MACVVSNAGFRFHAFSRGFRIGAILCDSYYPEHSFIDKLCLGYLVDTLVDLSVAEELSYNPSAEGLLSLSVVECLVYNRMAEELLGRSDIDKLTYDSAAEPLIIYGRINN